MELNKLAELELGRLDELDLPDVAVLDGVDALARLLDLSANDLGDELGNELTEVARRRLAGDDLEHLLSDSTDLRGLSVGGLGDLVGTAAGEGNAEDSEEVAVSRLNVLVALNERLPLANKRADLVRSEVHAVEVGQAGSALDLVDTELELAERLLVILVKVSERSLNDTALERVVGVLQTLGSVDKGLANVPVLEEDGGLDVVPVLAGEGVDSALLLSPTLGELLVLADS